MQYIYSYTDIKTLGITTIQIINTHTHTQSICHHQEHKEFQKPTFHLRSDKMHISLHNFPCFAVKLVSRPESASASQWQGFTEANWEKLLTRIQFSRPKPAGTASREFAEFHAALTSVVCILHNTDKQYFNFKKKKVMSISYMYITETLYISYIYITEIFKHIYSTELH